MAGRRGGGPLVHVVVVSCLVTALLSAWILVYLGGWAYYSTPLRVRGYAPAHALLKPSGSVAHPAGAVGFLMMLVPVVYALRKRWKALERFGSISAWIDMHIFCGIVGPVLVTFHTGFKFNGVVSVAYWSMSAVVLSGFVGRYLYVRIPKSIRGVELTRDEIQARAAALVARLAARGVAPALLEGFTTGAVLPRRRLRQLRTTLLRSGVGRHTAREVAAIAAERNVLIKRLVYLNRTKNLFAAWHVLHQPLVYLMFVIVVVHVGVALYFGYRWW